MLSISIQVGLFIRKLINTFNTPLMYSLIFGYVAMSFYCSIMKYLFHESYVRCVILCNLYFMVVYTTSSTFCFRCISLFIVMVYLLPKRLNRRKITLISNSRIQQLFPRFLLTLGHIAHGVSNVVRRVSSTLIPEGLETAAKIALGEPLDQKSGSQGNSNSGGSSDPHPNVRASEKYTGLIILGSSFLWGYDFLDLYHQREILASLKNHLDVVGASDPQYYELKNQYRIASEKYRFNLERRITGRWIDRTQSTYNSGGQWIDSKCKQWGISLDRHLPPSDPKSKLPPFST
jgi:hypothetical protein